MFRGPFRPFRRTRKDNVNQFIRARQVRVVFPDGVTEVLQTHIAVKKAKDLGLDLVMVSPTADPPVCKVMDYGEYTYQEKKKKNEAKKKQHRMEVKEVKFRPNTDDHDYNFKKNHALRFLQEGNKVKAVVFFRGREITHSDLGHKLLANLAKDVDDFGEIEGRPRLEGRQMHIIIGPRKTKKKETPPPPVQTQAAS
ncbi:MAG: translation initiation factor IF-3 [Acidobacteria bacterium]|nr:translation initiation factor IF-3 [Acidobacteriota bacterium]